MKLAMYQMKAAAIDHFEDTAERIYAMIASACAAGADLILLPECAYPAYMIGLDRERKFLTKLPEFLKQLSLLAARNRVYIVAGTALVEGERLYNCAVVFGQDGRLIAKAYKSNLWHFDGKWFSSGDTCCTFDTEFGKIGVMICADGRIPEIARMLRLRGAQLILDTVNLVASAREPQQLTNQQYQFILQTRARENGVYIAVCDKCGMESGAVTCLGRSFIATPQGEIAAECSPDREELLLYDVELPASPTLSERRPALYRILTQPTVELPIMEAIHRPYRLAELAWLAAIVRFDSANEQSYLEKAARAIEICELMDARLIVLPSVTGRFLLSRTGAEHLCAGLVDGTAVVATETESGGQKALFLKQGGVADILYATHLRQGGNADEIETASPFSGCRIAAIFEHEAEIPEIARVAMLKGADILLWFDRDNSLDYQKLMQTRAAENKIFVLRNTPCDEKDCSLAVNPDGAQVFTTFKTKDQIASGMLSMALSKSKEVVTGTNIVTGRIPAFYKELTI